MGIVFPFLGLMGVPKRWPTRLRNRLCSMQFTRNGMLYPLHLSLKMLKLCLMLIQMRIADGRFRCMG
ncbi:hypothetical protein Gotur_011327 [Gossypium turneri]